MLICKKCSAECSDTAKFCHICGERIDGKKRCEACGAWNEQDAVFCPTCGARVDGKTACTSCGTVFEGNFCPECGKPAKQVKAVGAPKEKKSGKVGEKVKSISELVSGACMALGALFALIFVFFICVEPSVLGASLSDLGIPGGDAKLNLYYFFGKAYEGLDGSTIVGETGSLQRWFELMNEMCMTEYAVVGTIVSALILLVVVGTSITAITLYVLKWLNKTEKSSNGWGMAAIISFIGSVLIFAELNKLSMKMLQSMEAVSITWSGATTAGFVLCAVFGGLAITAKFLAQGSAPWKGERLLKTVLSLVGVVLVCVWLGAVGGLGMRIEMLVSSSGTATVNTDIQIGHLLFTSLFLSAFPYSAVSDANKEFVKSKVSTVTTMSLICQILSIALIVLVVFLLLWQIKKIHKEQEQSKGVLVISTVVWVLSLVLCILCAISVGAIKDCSSYVENYLISGVNFMNLETTKYFAYNAAFTMVMSSICLLFTIAPKVLSAIRKTQESV